MHTPKDIAGYPLPLDAYHPTARQERTIIDAQAVLAGQCLRELGYRGKITLARRPPLIAWQRARRQVLLDEHAVAQGGFEPEVDHLLAAADTEQATPSGTGQPADLRLQAELLRGERASYHGKPVPDGGCQAQAFRKLTRGAEWPDGVPRTPLGLLNLVLDLSSQADDQARDDDRFKAVRDAWAACMADSGYDYATPADAIEDQQWERDGEGVSQAERKAALADLRCTRQTNFMGVTLWLRAAYEERVIDSNRDKLRLVKDLLQTRIRHATDVLSTQKQP